MQVLKDSRILVISYNTSCQTKMLPIKMGTNVLKSAQTQSNVNLQLSSVCTATKQKKSYDFLS